MLIIRALPKACAKYGRPPVPVVGFTGKEDLLERRELIRVGAQDFITAEEFRERALFARRLLQSVQEARVARLLEPISEAETQAIEEQIVQHALEKCDGDLTETAARLRWPLEEVRTISHRLPKRERLHDS